MKQFAVTSCVHYTDDSSGSDKYGKEYYSKIISAESEEEADRIMEKESLEAFKKDFNKDYKNIFVLLGECYETR